MRAKHCLGKGRLSHSASVLGQDHQQHVAIPRLRPFAPSHHDVAAVTSGLFVAKCRRVHAVPSASTSPGSSASGEQAQAIAVTIETVRVWDAMVYFHALADLVRRIQQHAPTWDSLNMSTLRDFAPLWCVNLVSLEANDKDKQHGVDSVVMYDDVVQALATATTDFVDFRNRPQEIKKLTNMLIALVAKGTNLFLDEVAAKKGEAFAEMTLHICVMLALQLLRCNVLTGGG